MEGAGPLGEIRKRAAADPPRFRPRFPWITGDLQTVRNMIVRPRPRFADAPAQRLHKVDHVAGGGPLLRGDRLA